MVDFKEIIAKELYDEAFGLTTEEIKDLIEIPADEKMGDYAFPCFRLAKALRKAPQMIAADIAARITDCEAFAKGQFLHRQSILRRAGDRRSKRKGRQIRQIRCRYGPQGHSRVFIA